MALDFNGSGIELSSDIRPVNGAPIALIADTFIRRGFRAVQTISERDSIPSSRKENGMHVYVIDTDKTYVLVSNVWVERSGFDQVAADLSYINRSKIVENKEPIEVPDGINTSFTTGDVIDLSNGLSVNIFIGNQKVFPNYDFNVVESGGAGSGFDTIIFLIAPDANDAIHLSYTRI